MYTGSRALADGAFKSEGKFYPLPRRPRLRQQAALIIPDALLTLDPRRFFFLSTLSELRFFLLLRVVIDRILGDPEVNRA